MLNKNQKLKVHSDETQKNENKETQHKIPQLKVHTGVRGGTICIWTQGVGWDCG
jgi:PII-like signaling protein